MDTSSGSMSNASIDRERRVRDVVDDADGEVVLRSVLASSSKTAFTIAGVNSLRDRP